MAEKTWKSNFAAILVAETLAIAGFSVSMPIIPLYLQDLGVSDPTSLKFWAGLVQSVAGITLAVAAPIWGNLADRYGRRVMLLRAMFGGMAVLGLMAFIDAPWQLLVLRAVQGALTGTVSAAILLTAGIAPAASVGFALGLLQTGVSIGNTLGPLVGGLVADGFGHRATFVATAAILAASGAIIAFGVADDFRPAPRGAAKGGLRLADFKPILSDPALMGLMAIGFALQAASSTVVPILPLFIQEISPDASRVASIAGVVLGAGAAASAVASAAFGRFSDRIGYARTLLICLAGGAVFYLPQAFAATPLQLTVFRVLALLFLGGAQPTVQALIAAKANRERQGSVYGLNSSISSAGAALGPAIGSIAAAAIDFRATFVVTAAILAATAFGVRREAAKRA
jgi:DHA1 family multidrug resistance protein-like MFS transporter